MRTAAQNSASDRWRHVCAPIQRKQSVPVGAPPGDEDFPDASSEMLYAQQNVLTGSGVPRVSIAAG